MELFDLLLNEKTITVIIVLAVFGTAYSCGASSTKDRYKEKIYQIKKVLARNDIKIPELDVIFREIEKEEKEIDNMMKD